jgi:phosphoribosyl-ATP pyrophosphohydrolase
MAHALDQLYARILERKTADPADSYTAKLIGQGTGKIAKKVGEEAVETALAGAAHDKPATIAESADLLYHLLVLWVASEITPDEVYAALEERSGRSGLAEKASRGGGEG